MNIILMGYRGCGKTTIGRKLAAQLWKEFVDVDVVCCKRFGNDSIAAIWEEHGEPAWRETEIEVVRELLAKDDHVIGLGSGTPMQPAAREAIAAADHARRIYLKCEVEQLARRIQADHRSAATRPALTAHGGSIDEIREVLAEREPVYEQLADCVFDVTHLDLPDAVRHVIKRCL